MKKTFAIDYLNLPKHIAIIMDGNGRWAKKRLLNRKAGHNAGGQAIKKLTQEMDKLGFKYLTVYAFSTENWKRSEEEVFDIMNILREFIKRYIEDAKVDNIKVKAIGERTRLDDDIQASILQLEDITKNKTGLCVTIAINYGGRDDIVRATKEIIKDENDRKINIDDIDETLFSSYLDTFGTPDPDMLIRTSGEMRLSNFLLWQCAYTEFFQTDKLWPDYKIDDLLKSVECFQNRDRRFGGRK